MPVLRILNKQTGDYVRVQEEGTEADGLMTALALRDVVRDNLRLEVTTELELRLKADMDNPTLKARREFQTKLMEQAFGPAARMSAKLTAPDGPIARGRMADEADMLVTARLPKRIQDTVVQLGSMQGLSAFQKTVLDELSGFAPAVPGPAAPQP